MKGYGCTIEGFIIECYQINTNYKRNQQEMQKDILSLIRSFVRELRCMYPVSYYYRYV